MTGPLYRLTILYAPVGPPSVAEVPGTTNHCCPTVGPPEPAAVTVGLVPQARVVVDVEPTPSRCPVPELATRYEPSPSEVKIHDSRPDPVADARKVVDEPPETWARTRPPPEEIR